MQTPTQHKIYEKFNQVGLKREIFLGLFLEF